MTRPLLHRAFDGAASGLRGPLFDALERRQLFATHFMDFDALRPNGARIYGADANASVTSGDSEDFAFTLPNAQRLSVQVTPQAAANVSTSLRPHVQILSADEATIYGDATASAAGGLATLQPIALPAGSYIVRVTGAASTSGGFNLATRLNSAFETETPGGSSNDSTGSATSLGAGAPQSILLQGGGRLSAVAGRADGYNGSGVQRQDLYRLDLSPGQSLSALLATADGGYDQFGESRTLDGAAGINFIRAADMNEDGRVDLITAGTTDSGGSTLNVMLDLGDGTYESYSWLDWRGVSDLVIADFDKDGHLDIAAASPGWSYPFQPESWDSSEVNVFFGAGDGTAAYSWQRSTDSGTHALAAGDFDDDGDLDLAVGRYPADDGSGNVQGSISTFENFGDGSFGNERQFTTDARVYDVEAADLNKDGVDDLVIGEGSVDGNSGRTTFIKMSADFPGYPASINTFVSSQPIINVAIGDLSGDGNLDVVSLRYGEQQGNADVYFLNQNGDITLSYGLQLTSQSFSQQASLELADVNRDGYLDAVVAAADNSSSGEQINVSLNDRTGFLFGGGSSYQTSMFTTALGLADLNGDGDLDFLTATNEANYDNDPPTSQIQIIDGRGVVQMDLLDAPGNVVARSVWGGYYADTAVTDFISQAGGTYYLRVTGDKGQRYQLAATVGAMLQREPDTIDNHAQDLTAAKEAVARIDHSGDVDDYALTLAAGDHITATAIARGNGTYTWTGDLQPIVQLIASDGTTVLATATATNGTASFDYTAAAAGTYTLRVRAASGEGDYDVRVSGASGPSAPMTIVGRNPAPDAFVDYQPLIILDFSLPIDLSSLSASDFLINGQPAQGFSAFDGDSVYFYDDRLRVDGTYTITIPNNSILSTTGKALAGTTWSFRVDANGPKVTSSSLHEGDTIAPGPLHWDVSVSEPLLDFISSGTFGFIILEPSDIVLTNKSNGTTSHPNQMSQDDYDVGLDYNFDWTTPLTEGAYEARLLSNLGAFQDDYRHLLDGEPQPDGSFPSGDGYPGGDFYVNFVVDAPGVTTLPPLTLAGPKGSLIHETSTVRGFHATGDVDSFNIDLDANQSITLVLEPSAGSSATAQLELFDPTGARIAIKAGGPGEPVVIQLAQGTAVGGLYRIDAKSLGGLAGYTLRVIVNAAVDADEASPGSNDSIATAQPLVLSPLVSGKPGVRGGVVGNVSIIDDSPVATAAHAIIVDEDYYRVDLTAGQIISVALSGSLGSEGSLKLVDSSGHVLTRGAGGSANSALGISDFVVPSTGSYYIVVGGNGEYGLVVTRSASIEREPVENNVPTQDLTRTGQIVGHVDRGGVGFNAIRVGVVGEDNPGTASGGYDPSRLIAQLNDKTFGNFAAVTLKAADVDTAEELAAYDVIVLGKNANITAGFATALRWWVEAGGSLVVTGSAIVSAGAQANLRAILPINNASSYNGPNNATLVPGATSHPVIDGITTTAINAQFYNPGAPINGAQTLATVNGAPAVVVRNIGNGGRTVFLAPEYSDWGNGNATLRSGLGDRLLEQAVAWAGSSGDRADDYRLSLAAGDTVTLTTDNPNGDTAQPVNLIDPILELYAPDGSLVASNDNGQDGRNARIVYTVPTGAGGFYRVVVRAKNVEGGDYVVNATGYTGSPNGTGASVIATSPQNGKAFAAPPTTIEFTLSTNILADSVSVDDLALQGGTVTGVQIIDGRTVRFTVSGLNAEGTYTYTLAAGAFTDLQGNPSQAYSGSYFVDRTGPKIVSVTPLQASAPFTGWTITFSEDIDPSTFTFADIPSITGPAGSGASSSYRNLTINGNVAIFEIYPQTVSGTYTFTITPNITDLVGNKLDQDGDGNYGEAVDDRVVTSTTVASPNLVVENVQVVGSAVYGSPVTIRWTVRNAGSDPALTGWNDRVYLSVDGQLDGGDLVLGNQGAMTVPLAAGGTYTREATFNLPLNTSVTPGSFRFLVQADSNFAQLESNDNDNVGASTATNVTLPPLPDLAVTNVELVTPANPYSGQPATIRWTLTNSGTQAINTVIRDEFYLSPDNAAGGDTSLGGSDYAVNLAPGASVTRTAIVNLPINQFGTRYFVVKTDAFNAVFEHTNEANNTALSGPVSITVAPLVDLVVSDITAPASVQSGTSQPITWTLSNTGTSDWSGTITERIYLSADGTIGNDTEYKTVSFTGFIPAGGSITRSESIGLPINLSGTFRAVVVTDADNNVFENEGESNNASIDDQAMLVTLPPTPDLIVTSLTTPATSLSGRGVPVSWTLKNDGTAAVSGSFVERVYLSADNIIGNADDLSFGEFTFNGTIAVGQTVTRTVAINLPNVFAGTYHLVVVTDAGNSVFENTNEGNNASIDDGTLTVTQAPYPNLVVENVIAPTTALSAETIELTWTVRNTGGASTNSGQWYDAVYLSANDTFDSTDTRLAYFGNASYLNAAEAYQRTETITLPNGLQGTYHLFVVTDAFSNVFEYVPNANAEADNMARSAAINVTLSEPPDLVVTNVVAPLVAFSGSNATIGWTVANHGTGPTRPNETTWTDQVYLSTDNTWGGNDVYLGELRHVGGLAVDGSYSSTLVVRLPIGISGPYYFIVRTDVDGQVYENAFDANNTTAETTPTDVRLSPPPDLVTKNVSVPTTGTAGRTLNVKYRVDNDGASATPQDSWVDRVYLSASPTFDPATAIDVAARSRYGLLAAGDGYDVSIPASVPLTAEGTYYVFVISDSENKVFELDNANNAARSAGTVTITKQFADLQVTTFNPPSSAAAGTSVPFTWTITNAGVGDTITTRWWDRIVLSADNVFGNGDDIFFLNGNSSIVHNGLLEPGGSYTVTKSLAIPAYVPSGTYNVFFATDANGNVTETNDANNTNASNPPQVVIGQVLPDLRVTTVTAPATASGGSTIPVSFTVKNAGGAQTNASNWIDEIWVSADTTIGTDDIRLRRMQRTNGLQADGSYTIDTFVTLPTDLVGNYYIIVRTDADDGVIEGAQEGGNNDRASAAMAVSLRAVPDLSTTSVVAPAESYAGQKTRLSWTVRNDGAAIAASPNGAPLWYDTVYLSLDSVFDRSDLAVYSTAITSGIAADGSYTLNRDVELPPGVSGPYYLIVVSDAGDRIYERGLESNNIRASNATNVVLLPPADLVAGTILLPANGSPGRNASITYTVDNNSSQPAKGRWNDSLFISADATWDINDKLFARVEHVGDVAAGGSYSATVTAALPGVTPGEYYVIVRSDIGNQVPESDEQNNLVASLTNVLLDVPNLTLGTPATDTIGKNQAVYYRVDVPAGETLLIDFDAASSSGSTQLFVKYGSVPTRADFDYGYGSAVSADQKIIVPKTKAGTYYILAYGDGLSATTSFNITARTLQFDVVNDNFGKGGNRGNLTLKVDGAKFDRTVQAELVDGNGNVIRAAKQMWYGTSVRLYATFDLKGLPVGSYDVRFTKPGAAPVTVEHGLQVVTGTPGAAKPVIFAPNFTFAGGLFQFTVAWGNEGLNDAYAPLIVAGADRPVSFFPDGESSPSFTFLGVGQDDGPSGILRPDQTSQRELYARNGPRGSSIRLVADRLGKNPSELVDWSAIHDDLIGTGDYSDAEFEVAFNRMKADIGPTWGDYLAALGESASLIPIRLGNNRVPASILALPLLQASAKVSTSLTGKAVLPDIDVPIANRDVLATNRATGKTFVTYSLNDGTFIFDRLDPGTYDLSFDGATIVSGGSFTVAAGEHASGLVLTLRRGSSISGAVRDAANNPIAGAAVTAVTAAGLTATAVTDENGAYTLNGIAAGEWTLFVDAPGMARATAQVTVDADGAAGHNFTLQVEGRAIGKLTFAAGPEAQLFAVVRRLNGDGQPSSGAANTFRVKVTGDRIDVSNLPSGNYRLSLSRRGYIGRSVAFSIPAAGAQVDLGTIAMLRSASVAGTVTSSDPSVSPAYLFVGVFAPGGTTPLYAGQTNGLGEFEMVDLAPGTYELRPVLGDGYADPISVTVTSGQTVSGLQIAVKPGGTIAGTLRTSSGGAVIGGEVTLVDSSGQRLATVTTDAQGNFRFDRLARGGYTVVASNVSSEATVNTLDASPTVNVALTLNIAGVITGTLRNGSGQPISGSVAVFRDGKGVALVQANGQGRYQVLLTQAGIYELRATSARGAFMPLAGVEVANGTTLIRDFVAGSGTLRLTVQGANGANATVILQRLDAQGNALDSQQLTTDADGVVSVPNLIGGDYRVTVFAGANAGVRQTVAVAGSGVTNVTLAATAALGTVSGRVVDASTGQPIVAGRLMLVDASGTMFVGAGDADGNFQITNVPSGTYELRAYANGYALATRAGVVIDTEGHAVTVELPLTSSSARITGRLVDAATGQPLRRGASVSVTSADGRLLLGSAFVGGDGTFSIVGPTGTGLRIVIDSAGTTGRVITGVNLGAGGTAVLGDITITSLVHDGGILPAGASPTAPSAPTSPTSSSADGRGRATVGSAAPVAAATGTTRTRTSANGASPAAIVPAPVQASVSREPVAPSSFFTELPGWVFEVFAEIEGLQRDPNELTRDQVPPVDECKHCENARRTVLNNITITERRWDILFDAGEALHDQVYTTGLAFAADLTLFISTVGKLGLLAYAASQVLAGAIVVGEAATAGEATVIALNLVEGVLGLKNQLQQLKSSASLDGALQEIQQATLTVQSLAGLLNNGLHALGKFIQAGVEGFTDRAGPIGDAIGFLVDMQGTLDKLTFAQTRLMLQETSKGLDYLKDMDRQYRQQVIKTYKSLTAYKTCLKNADEECEDDDPDPPSEPPEYIRIVPTLTSLDPNDISGPQGYGPQNFVSARTPLGFTIRFENDATASAPAHHVRITQKLDSDLDARTFRLGDFGFGGLFFNVPADSSFYQTRIDLTETQGIYLDVIAGVDISTGEAFWEFISIDPATGDEPTNPLLGFLPANVTSPEGEGFVKYTIRAMAGAATGTVIDSLATIVFDDNEPIDTPAIFHTLDAVAASSLVTPIAQPALGSSDIGVSWAGEDDADGSAIASYDVYVAIDGKPFTLWLDDTTLTDAIYRGQGGHSYAFYTVATDNAGNVEAPPAVADASITLAGNNVDPVIENLPTTTEVDEGATLTLDGNVFDPNAADTHTVQVDYGDGAGFQDVTVATDGAVHLSTTYGDNGAKQIVVKVSDSAGGASQTTVAVNVRNVAPTIAPINDVTLNWDGSGATLAQLTAADDAGADDVLTAEADFGNGTFETVAVAADGTIALGHRFATPGTYAVTLRVHDDDGATTVRTFNVTVLPPASVVQQMNLNGSSTAVQRSMITSFTLTFDGAAALTPQMLQLARRPLGGGAMTPVTDVSFVLTPIGTDGKSWQVTFTGSGVTGGSLADGVYQLTVGGSGVAPSSYSFYRLFGDVNGDRVVDRVDEAAFRSAYRSSTGEAAFAAGLDYDGNGVIDRSDEAAFRDRNRQRVVL